MFNHPIFYKKKLFILLELYGSLIKDGKARTFQSAIKMVREKGEEPRRLKKIMAEVERELNAGCSLIESLQITILYEIDLNRFENEAVFIKNSQVDTSAYSYFECTTHDWGKSSPEQIAAEEEFSEKAVEIMEKYGDDFERSVDELNKLYKNRPPEVKNGTIVESKLCQMCISMLTRARQEEAEALIIDWSEPIKDMSEINPAPVLLQIDGEKIQVFDIPRSLTFSNVSVFLGLADLPYWTKEETKGPFKVFIEDEVYSGEVHYQPVEKLLTVSLK